MSKSIPSCTFAFMNTTKKSSPLPLALMAALTLGLAPFVPEPHIWGKIKWLAGGGEGMAPMDYFDVLLHGAPWVYLFYVLLSGLRARWAK